MRAEAHGLKLSSKKKKKNPTRPQVVFFFFTKYTLEAADLKQPTIKIYLLYDVKLFFEL